MPKRNLPLKQPPANKEPKAAKGEFVKPTKIEVDVLVNFSNEIDENWDRKKDPRL